MFQSNWNLRPDQGHLKWNITDWIAEGICVDGSVGSPVFCELSPNHLCSYACYFSQEKKIRESNTVTSHHLSSTLLISSIPITQLPPKPLCHRNTTSLISTLVFLVTAFVKCKFRGVVGHEKLFEQGLNNFTNSIGAADVKCIHTVVRQAKSSFVIAVSTPPLAGGRLHSDRSA